MVNKETMSKWMPNKPSEEMTSEDWEKHFDDVNNSLYEVSEAVSAINNNIDDFRRKAKAQAEEILDNLVKVAEGDEIERPDPEKFKELKLLLKLGFDESSVNRP